MSHAGAGRHTSSPTRGEASLSPVDTLGPLELGPGSADGVWWSTGAGVRVGWVTLGAVTWAAADVKPLPD